MSLKNYTSEGRNTFEKIQQILSANGATKIMFDYVDGLVVAISFGLEIDGNPMGFKLPAMTENVVQILYGRTYKSGLQKKITNSQRAQAYKTAWANIRDWIDAQMALVATKQAKINHIFLPYLVMKNGETLAEQIEKNPSLLLGDGK
jgi:hypothetical protein